MVYNNCLSFYTDIYMTECILFIWYIGASIFFFQLHFPQWDLTTVLRQSEELR